MKTTAKAKIVAIDASTVGAVKYLLQRSGATVGKIVRHGPFWEGYPSGVGAEGAHRRRDFLACFRETCEAIEGRETS